ncbi:hypothetical protein BBP13_12485, partial [Limosilactobacillus reuteri]
AWGGGRGGGLGGWRDGRRGGVGGGGEGQWERASWVYEAPGWEAAALASASVAWRLTVASGRRS